MDWGSGPATARPVSHPRPRYPSARPRGSVQSQHRGRCGAYLRTGVLSCRVSRSATHQAHRAVGLCCRPGGAQVQRADLVVVLPGLRHAGSGSSGPAPPDRDREVGGWSRSGPLSDAAPAGTPPGASGLFGLPELNSEAGHLVSCAARPARRQLPPQRTQTVRLPRWRRLVSYSAQFVTRYCCRGM